MALFIAMSPGVGSVPAAVAASTTVDDGSSQIAWTGYWNVQRDARFRGGTEKVVEGAGASAQLTFTGNKVTVFYSKGPDRAKASVTIDGKAQAAIDQYGSRAFQQSVTYTLSQGQHTIVVRNSGSRTNGSTGWWIALDAFVVDSTTVTPTATTAAATPTATSVPATATSVPPTATSVPATATSVPPTAVPPTATSVPPTATPGGTPAPVAGQQCPAWVHDRYTAAAPDGRQYPTWHPPTDPTYRCWFGHEHGDDPAGSPALRGRPAPAFGYVGAQVGDNEPHVGFKIFRWDNIRHPNAPNHDGAFLLMAVHQGTAGAARFTTVHHSVVFHYYNPRDGREVHLQMMAPFGTLLVGCGANDPNMVLSQQQANVPGARQVAADKCFNLPAIPYEDWITAMYVGTDNNGGWRAYVDPHFAIFNPNTYCIPSNGACQLAYSDVRAGTGAAPTGPQSWFKGEHREAYLNQVHIDNAGRGTTVWTDAYGKLAAANAPGAIPQFISAQNLRPTDNSAAFGADRDYDDGTVRAPN